MTLNLALGGNVKRATHSSVDLATMPESEHEDDKLIVDHVVDNSVVTHPDTQLTVTAAQLKTARRTRFSGKRVDSAEDAASGLAVELPQ